MNVKKNWSEWLRGFRDAATEGTPAPVVAPAAEPAVATPAAPASMVSGDGAQPPVAAAPEGTPPVEPAPVVEPITFENFTVPEGFAIADADRDAFLAVIGDDKLTAVERGQKLIDLQVEASTKAAAAAAEAGQALWNETQEQWRAEVRKLPGFEGDKLNESLAQVKKGLILAGATDETFAALDLTGAGNHPAIVKVLSALTKNLTEGAHIEGGSAKKALSFEERAAVMYPSTQQTKE